MTSSFIPLLIEETKVLLQSGICLAGHKSISWNSGLMPLTYLCCKINLRMANFSCIFLPHGEKISYFFTDILIDVDNYN